MLKRYLIRRLLHFLLLLAGVSVLAFVLLEIAPGNFLDDAKLNPQLSRESFHALQARYGLDKPIAERYLYWIASAAKGDLGVSFAYNLPVSTLLWPRARKTLELTVLALLLSWILAIALGIWSAAARGGWLDRALAAALAALLAVPDLVLACVALLVAVRFGFFHSNDLRLPLLVLVLGALPMLVRHTRAALLANAEQPFARTARANGISGWRYWLQWILPPSANALLSLFGLTIGGLISASLVVEIILGWPGLGPLFLEAIEARDFYLVLGPVMLSALFLAAGTLIGDLLLYLADPRIRAES